MQRKDTGPKGPVTATMSLAGGLEAPVEGAELKVCKNGANMGLRYWACEATDKWGNTKLTFFQWVDEPRDDIKAMVRQLQELTKVNNSMLERLMNQ